jgi:hypothetical protein
MGTTMNAPLGQLELLSEKLSRHLAPDDWQTLFQGSARSTILFVRKTVTVLYAQPVDACTPRRSGSATAFVAKVKFLSGTPLRRLDRYSRKAAVVFFEDAADAMRMAMELQRCSSAFRCAPASTPAGRCGDFHGQWPHACHADRARNQCGRQGGCDRRHRQHRDLALDLPAGAARIAGPDTDCLLTEEFMDSDEAQASITPAPMMGGTGAQHVRRPRADLTQRAQITPRTPSARNAVPAACWRAQHRVAVREPAERFDDAAVVQRIALDSPPNSPPA